MKATTLLNNLIETLKDGEQGFKTAASDIESVGLSADLKQLFLDYSSQRSRLAAELQSLARSLGETDPAESGSVAGALHRGWIDLKAAITSRDEHAVLAECERGEDVAVAAYKKALAEEDLPSAVRDTLQTQYAEVKRTHDHVRNLRDSLVTK